ncbi:MAG: hypothetical protein HQM16_04520 [Deltaproteobacteria bacterium]|nr:hypothetical protein [Deltaproteobacteria bacterium]
MKKTFLNSDKIKILWGHVPNKTREIAQPIILAVAASGFVVLFMQLANWLYDVRSTGGVFAFFKCGM